MKKLALIMMFSVSSVVLSAEEFTIQTISAQKEASITPAFEKKVQKSALLSTKKKEGSCNIVTVGKYPSAKAAHHDLGKAKAISKDAFVRSVDRTTPKACESRGAAKEHTVQAKPSVNPQPEVKAVVAHETAPVKKEEPVVAEHASVAADHPATVSAPVQVKSEPCKTQPCTNVTYLYDRNLAHKGDVQEAIEYYKRSPYYSFKPVVAPQRF
ncbi:hypothetical protein [Sulfuricurvum sp.]|uniref:hypothetical protein n=1 Tax=Sulfuricurvum sp. TaxID=2025608 RepID=UPI002E311F83|nr:hypothetical protein [Sulfuricurvum sp.]HEX5329635.1 hypothetical protein [Sulfuricurvum sp.]